MRSSSSLLLSCCALACVLALALSGPAPATASRLDSVLAQLAHSTATPPTLSAPTARVVANHSWFNCDASLPVQFDDVLDLVVRHDVYLSVHRLHTAVDVYFAYFQANTTYTPPGGTSSSGICAFGLETRLLPPAMLPIAAGSADVLLSSTDVYSPQLGHFVRRAQLLDGLGGVIGCEQHEFDVVQA